MRLTPNNDGLEYCKKGIHRMMPVNRHGDFQCAECGHQEHKCDLRCRLHVRKCSHPAGIKYPKEVDHD